MATVKNYANLFYLGKNWFFLNLKSCLITFSLAVGSLLFDLVTPLGVAAGVIYVLFVLSAFCFSWKYTSFVFAAIASAFVLKGYFLISEVQVISTWVVLLNRALSVLVLWIVASVIYFQKVSGKRIVDASERTRVVTDTVLDGLITLDSEAIVQSFNPAAERIFGYKPEEVVGRNVKMLMPDPYHSEHDGYVSNYLNTGDRKVIGIGREVSARRKNGSIFPMELGINEMQFEGRRMFVGTIRDITERKEAVAEILRSNQELERFAYVASHDLQEPLRMVVNFTQLLEKRYLDKLDEKGIEYIKFASDSASRMQSLVKDLLEYARIGNEAETKVRIDLDILKESIEENLFESIRQTNAVLTWDTLPSLLADPVRIRSVFQNIIGNSIKYRSSKLTPRIDIKVNAFPDEWLFSIADNGVGMNQAYCEKIFEPFKRLHRKEEYSGTGMGLSICRKSVEGLGGKIWAESKIGQGSTFYFTIPRSSGDTI